MTQIRRGKTAAWNSTQFLVAGCGAASSAENKYFEVRTGGRKLSRCMYVCMYVAVPIHPPPPRAAGSYECLVSRTGCALRGPAETFRHRLPFPRAQFLFNRSRISRNLASLARISSNRKQNRRIEIKTSYVRRRSLLPLKLGPTQHSLVVVDVGDVVVVVAGGSVIALRLLPRNKRRVR